VPFPDSCLSDFVSGVFSIAAAADGGVGGALGIKNEGMVATEDIKAI
jgi:hypothetical protein